MATGTIAAKFARTVREMEDEGERVVAVASRSEEKARAFAAEHGIARAFKSYEALLEADGIDAVYIATPNSLHAPNTRLCLDAGKHVLCEKPFTLRADEALRLYGVAEKKGLFLLEGVWIRFLPLYKNLLPRIGGGEFGELRHARCDYGFVAEGARRERKFRAELGGGALYDIGIYTLGFLEMVMGCAPESFSSNARMNEFGTDEASTVGLLFPGGRTAQCAQAIGFPMAREAALYFDKATVRIPDFQNAAAFVVERGGAAEREEFPFDVNGFEYQIREFSACVRGGKTESDFFTHSQSVSVLSLMERIRSSWNMAFPSETAWRVC